MRRLCVGAICLIGLASIGRGEIIGGLWTGCASPDGKLAAFGGDTRVVYIYRLPELGFEHRFWVAAKISVLAFINNGKELVVVGDDDTARIYATADWSMVREVKDVKGLTLSGDGKRGAFIGGGWKPEIKVVDLADWSEVTSWEMPENKRPGSLALTADGSKLMVLTAGFQDKAETEGEKPERPEDQGEAELWKLRHDGRAAELHVIDVASGKAADPVHCFTTGHQPDRLHMLSDTLATTINGRVMAMFDLEKKTMNAQVLDFHAFGHGTMPDGRLALILWNNNGISFMDGKGESITQPVDREHSLGDVTEFFPVGDKLLIGFSRRKFKLFAIDPGAMSITKTVNCY